MTGRDIMQTQFFNRTTLAKADSKDLSKKTSYKSQHNDFDKVLASKKDEQQISRKSKLRSEDTENISKKQAPKDENVSENKEACKNKEVSESKEESKSNEASKSDEIKDDQIIEKAEAELTELDSMVGDLISTLQLSNVIDEEKLQSIIKDIEAGNLKLDEIKSLLEGLELQLIDSQALSGEIKDKLLKTTQLFEILDQPSVEENTNQSADNNLEADMSRTNNLSLETKTVESNDANLNTAGSSSNDNMINQDIDVKPAPTTDEEGKSQEKNTTSDLEMKISLDDNENIKEQLFIKKNLNDDSLQQKDVDLVDIKNIQVEGYKGNEMINANKTLPNAPRPDMNIFNQIIESARINVSEDVSEMLIKMKPDNLGKLSMKIVVERGMLVARFEVESQIVKEAIESNLEDLRNALKDKGFEVQQFDVSVNKDSDNTQKYFSHFNKHKSKKMAINNEINVKDPYFSSSQGIEGLTTTTINYLG